MSDCAALGGTDRVDWSIVGSVQPPFKVLPNSFSVTSEQGLGINVSIPPAAAAGVTPLLLFQTLLSPGIPSNFASGDFILLIGLRPGSQPAVGNPGPLTITQKLADISLAKGKSKELWSELDETSQAAVSGGASFGTEIYLDGGSLIPFNGHERGAGSISFVSPKNLVW